MYQYLIKIFSGLVLLLAVTACTPTIKVAVPDKPITINLNVKIDQEIRVKVDNDLNTLMKKDSSLF